MDLVYQWKGQSWEVWRDKTLNWGGQKYELEYIKEIRGVKLNKTKI